MTPSELSQSQQSNMILSGQSLSQASNLNPFNGVASIAEYLSPEQIDLLSDQDRKSVVNTLLSKVSLFFEEKTKKHRLDVEFSEEVSGLLESISNDLEGITLKKSGGSAGGSHCRTRLYGDSRISFLYLIKTWKSIRNSVDYR